MNGKLSFAPEQASEFAVQADAFFYFMVGVSTFFTVLIAVLVVALAVRYRRRTPHERPEAIKANSMLEIIWSVIPLILALIMFFWSAHLYFQYAKAPDDAMEILVTGKQWMWKIQHPNGKREINELHIPMGQDIKLTMTSEDVIHSFFIPAFRVKMDAVPGRYTSLWFKPTKEGKFHLFCAEYCGTEHSEMVGSVYVMAEREYTEWLGGAAGAGESPVKAGENLFNQLGCATCHHSESGSQGPDLAGVFGTQQTMQDGSSALADESYIRESILYPQKQLVVGYQPIMPTFKGLVSETQLMQIIAYIKSIAPDKSEPSEDAS